MPSTHRVDDLALHARLQFGVDERARRERAHAARVRPAIAVEDALVVLRGAEGDRALAVTDREEGHFRTGKAFLEHDAGAGGAELTVFHHRAYRVLGFDTVRGHDDALPRGQTVSLDHNRQTELAARDRFQRIGGGIADAKARRRNSVAGHERFRERFTAFELGRDLGRSENAMPRRAKPIDDATIEWQLGTDDREIEALAIGERTELVDGATLHGFRARVARDPGVARRALTEMAVWRASARTSACSRPPEPMTRTFIRAAVRASTAGSMHVGHVH